jgi:hypothetical protein
VATPLLEEVRTACAEVAGAARQVRIVESTIPRYAAALDPLRLAMPQMDPACHYLGHGEATLAFLLTLDAVNFGSGYFPAIFARPEQSGFLTVAAALTAYFERHGPLSAAQLARLNSDDCARIFGFSLDRPAAGELITEFAASLNQLGTFVLDGYGGDFSRLVAAAGGSAERLVGLLAAIPSFADIACWRGRRVPFYKRAQLAAADLHIAFGGAGAGNFADVDALTICADNLVPHVLRWDGVLHYAEALAARIDGGELLAAGSEEEVEIRAAAVHAGELLVAELHRSGRPVNALQLDNALWYRGQQPFYRLRPRHRTRTIFY